MKKTLLLPAVLAATLAFSGCSTYLKKTQLEKVAKDWCLVVRASQVIPVYPLTEDLQPGDVFLVQTPASEEARIYTCRGFLPLEQRLVRMHVTNYEDFYANQDIRGNMIRPFQPFGAPNHFLDITNAPRAAFPSYSFDVSSGGGFNLALPIQGVPVALNLMGADQANGNITISDAYTYGTDIQSLITTLQDWADENVNRLAPYAASLNLRTKQQTYYLRVVTRVYLTKRVNVSLTAAGSFGAAGSAGSDKQVNTPLSDTNSLKAYTNMLASLNASTSNAVAPGGSFKYASATSRSVSLDETFPRPLVIGYLAFDVPIYRAEEADAKGGTVPPIVLGAPSPTWSKLNGNSVKSVDQELYFQNVRDTQYIDAQDTVDTLVEDVKKLSDAAVLKLMKNLPIDPGATLSNLIKLRDPGDSRLTDPAVAKQMLEMIIIQCERTPAEMAAWTAALKLVE